MLVTIVIVAVLIMSAVVHEYAHGWAAWRQGDTTAKDAGRLTLNPLKHLSWFGSVILPLILVLSRSPIFFAWAKPVPINPYRFRDVKYGEFKVAAAGPLSNFILAILFSIIARVLPLDLGVKLQLLQAFFGGDYQSGLNLVAGSLINGFYVLSLFFVMVNLALGLFNLLPWPPLDGSRLIYPWLPEKVQRWFDRLETSPFSLLILFLFIYSGLLNPLFSLIPTLFGYLAL